MGGRRFRPKPIWHFAITLQGIVPRTRSCPWEASSIQYRGYHLLALVLGSSLSAQRLALWCPPAPHHILSGLTNVSNARSERILKLQHTQTPHHTSRHPPDIIFFQAGLTPHMIPASKQPATLFEPQEPFSLTFTLSNGSRPSILECGVTASTTSTS